MLTMTTTTFILVAVFGAVIGAAVAAWYLGSLYQSWLNQTAAMVRMVLNRLEGK